MSSFTTNLLRRTTLLLGAATALFLSVPAAAQTATLSTGQSCTYSSMTVLPNGSVSINCSTSSTTSATISLVGPTSLAPGATSAYQISRSGGSETSINVAFNAVGGCTVSGATSPVSLTATGTTSSASFNVTAPGTAGTCTVSITPTSGIASPGSITVAVGSTTAPPPGPAGCPAPPAGSGYIASSLAWGEVKQMRMASGVIASFPVIAPQAPKVSIVFSQGGQGATPGGVVTDISVTKCPGVIDTSVPQCYQRSTSDVYIAANIYEAQVFTWNSQSTLGSRGCWAPASEGPWYVNLRWTYSSCPYSNGCGFSLQWSNGSY